MAHNHGEGSDCCSPAPGHSHKSLTLTGRIALVGSPNAGKSTLFNQLTGMHVKTGNYPGVTVGRAVGSFNFNGDNFEVEDLPGTYSLEPASTDEKVVADVVNGSLEGIERPDALVVVADATSLRRSLILLAEVLHRGLPTVLAVTMMDEFTARGGNFDIELLSTALGIPVVALDGRSRSSVDQLRAALPGWRTWQQPILMPPTETNELDSWISSVLDRANYKTAGSHKLTAGIDRVLLHPITGTAIFMLVLFAFFQIIFTLVTPIQDAIDGGFASLGDWVREAFGQNIFTSFVADGLIGGIGGVLVFVPQIALLFIMLAVLEQSGYLSRAAFLMDRVMSVAGLEGRAFVAMLSSFACAIPGIMATRTLPSARDRFATMMTVPLITCSARLPVYSLIITMLMPQSARVWIFNGRGVALFGMYLLGAVSMMIGAKLVTVMTGRRGFVLPFSMEMPNYRWPKFKSMAVAVWMPVRGFLTKVGKIILLTTIVMWVLLNLPMQSTGALQKAGVDPSDSGAVATYTMEHSIAGTMGHALEPVFDPLGFDWRVNVAVLSSLSARETFVATLGQISAAQNPDSPRDAVAKMTFTSGPDAGKKVFTPPTMVALLMFFAYALQCMATVGALRRETGTWKWPLIAYGVLLGTAWVAGWIGHTVTAAIVGA